MPHYEILTKDQLEGAFSSHPYHDSSRSSTTSKGNRAITKQSKQGESVQLRRLKKLRDLRDKLFRSRLRLREKRVELREEREVLGELDSRLMSSLRKYWQQEFLHETPVFQIYTELEEKRDEVGSLQYEYDQAEDEHEMIEAELEKEEELLSLSYDPIINREDHEEHDTQRASTQTSESIDHASIPSEGQQSGALDSRYQSRLGDARIVRERLQDRYIDLEKRNGRVIGVIDSDDGLMDTASVRELELAITKAQDELRIIEEDLDYMKKSVQEVPIAMSQPPVPKESHCSVYDQTPSMADLVDHCLPAGPSTSGLSHVQIGFRGGRSCWILDCLKSSSVDKLHRKAVGQADPSDYLADRIWLRFVLRRYDEFGEMIPSGPLEPTKLQLLSVKEHWIQAVRILVFDLSRVSTAVHEFDNQFPTASVHQNEISWSPHKIGGLTYKDGNLDHDLLSEYESRSV